jgi:hypothetical protein
MELRSTLPGGTGRAHAVLQEREPLSVVTRDVEPFTVCGGVPAKLIKRRTAASADRPSSGLQA